MAVVLGDDLLLVLLHLDFLHDLLVLEIWLFLLLKLLLLLTWIFSSWHHLSKLVDWSLVGLIRVLRNVFCDADWAKSDLRWMALRDYVQWLLHILKDDLTTLFKSGDLNFYNFANWFPILFYIFNTLIIFDNPRDAKVKGAKYDSLLDIFDEG